MPSMNSVLSVSWICRCAPMGARAAFESEYRRRVAQAYPRRPDGKTLFPFRRLFIVAGFWTRLQSAIGT